jgi:hypothetical protein
MLMVCKKKKITLKTTHEMPRYKIKKLNMCSALLPSDVETRIQKAKGAFRLRKIWLAHYVNKDTKMKLFNVCVKSVLLYGCQTWLVTCEIQRKLQSFVNRCLRYIMKIWWPRVISNGELWEMTGQININAQVALV